MSAVQLFRVHFMNLMPPTAVAVTAMDDSLSRIMAGPENGMQPAL
jgi:hypothetical protein